MVSLWPWKGSRSSPDEFEKQLSHLSEKLTQTQTTLDKRRARARRYRALWTLYSVFAYLLALVILVLVLGLSNWGPWEYTGVAGGPVVIYLVRHTLNAIFNYAIQKTSDQLLDLQKQRDETIDRLKEATKYNSTQKLLRKYASKPSSPAINGNGNNGDDPGDGTKRGGRKQRNSMSAMPGRTNLPPPPTANIRRPPQSPPPGNGQGQMQMNPQSPPNLSVASSPLRPGSAPGASPSPTAPQTPTPSRFQQHQHMSQSPASPPYDPATAATATASSPNAEFAPNAFDAYPQHQYPPSYPTYQPHWYDRLFDVLLGEDETSPKNRIVLLCAHCKTVNGQAPPGVKSLEELGGWRCGFCGGWNGKVPGRGAGEGKGHGRKRSESQPVEAGEGAMASPEKGLGDGYHHEDDLDSPDGAGRKEEGGNGEDSPGGGEEGPEQASGTA